MKLVELEIWLAVGREGRSFTYKDGLNLGIDIGDFVLVKLKGRSMHGLVIGRRINSLSNSSLLNVESIIQKAAVDATWYQWINAMATFCYATPFQMLKAALPPGWLGRRKILNKGSKKLWWVGLQKNHELSHVLSLRQKELKAQLVAVGGGSWLKDLTVKGFSVGLIMSFISKGYAYREKRDFSLDSTGDFKVVKAPSYKLEPPQELTEEQQVAINIFESTSAGSATLLWGVTGSGKTEVYLQLASKELSEGRHCIILTPEIGLIPQLVDRFSKRFGPRVFEYHSHCREKHRVSTWRMALNASASEPVIIIGTRSAIFLPLSPLGLIVLDEEHDSSYKQESPMPCYHAKDLALDRAKRTDAKVVLGSATPSLSTWKDTSPKGPISVARLTRRISNYSLPKVFVVDMRKELAAGHRRLISRDLMSRLSGLPQSGEQAVVLVPRRGYSSFLSCRSCGEVVQCPNCDVALTVHRTAQGSQWLRCHWCDYRESINKCCKECGSFAFKPFGAGTQKVIEHLAEELDGLKLLRFDRDTTTGQNGHRRLLEKFASGEADVLIGTQMLAKGMDLPRVTLAVVLAADGLLHRPDLLAEEQTLQLFMQLAGRAGRGERPGEVLVQTYCPTHPVILHLMDGRYEEFLKQEAKIRNEAGLVPYRRACLLRLSGESASVTATAATSLAEQIRAICEEKGWNIVGPAPALITRVAGRSRWQILLHGPEASLLPLPKDLSLWNSLPKGVSLAVDPDPLQL
tara:strand:+ start:1771 stop:4005 length:2235 start_codon:yes stop_codon:yes gene_type:complete